jgi:predicted patatin/cPLA2 family phospholipase
MEGSAVTTKELGFIEELVKMEVLCASKLEIYEREVRDPELRELCRSGLRTAERHIDELLSLLR